MSSIRLKHASGNSMSLAAPGTNPASNLELKLPHTIGSANQLLKVDANGQLGWATDSTTDSTKLPLAGGTLTGTLTSNSNINTTGAIAARDITLTDTDPGIIFTDSDGNPDYQIVVNAGHFMIKDATASADRLYINASSTTITNNLNVNSGVDITGILSVYKTGTNSKLLLSRNESVGTDNTETGVIDFANNTGHTVNARIMAKTSGTGNVGGQLVIETRDPSNSTLNERLRITSRGAIQSWYNSSLPVTDSRPILQLGYGVIGDNSSGYNDVTCNAYPVNGDSSYHYIGSPSLGASRYHIGFGDHKWFTASAGTRGNDITWSEKLRINSSGVVQVVSERLALGTSITNGGANDGNLCVEFSSASRNAVKLRDTHNTGSTTYMVLVGGSATVGSITGTTGQASYNNLSDYRSKENDVKITDGIAKLKLLRPIRFNYKTDSSTLCDGFFAHEVTPAVPTAVTGEKDAVNSEGKIDAQMLDTSKMVPLLTAALQEAITKIETLETKVAALEAG